MSDDECFKCGSTENLKEVIAYPANYNEPDVEDFICSNCLEAGRDSQ